MAYITSEAFPARARKSEAAPVPKEQATIYRPPHVTRPVSENKLTTGIKGTETAPRTPPPDTSSYEFQRNAANFHQSESRLNSPGMLQMQFEANAARFHSNTPAKKDPAAFKAVMDPLFPKQREDKQPPNTAGSQFQKSAAQFYASTPPPSAHGATPVKTAPGLQSLPSKPPSSQHSAGQLS